MWNFKNTTIQHGIWFMKMNNDLLLCLKIVIFFFFVSSMYIPLVQPLLLVTVHTTMTQVSGSNASLQKSNY